jgi:heptosyltransferase-1
MRILVVKVSSLGDIIHTLPAVSDAARAIKNIRFDWVVEESFTEIPAWHPAVDKVIPVALRRWRKNLFQTWRSGEFSAFKKNLQERHYDLIIDAQGLIKSGFISRLAKGLTAGLSDSTIRERQAAMFYNVKFSVPWHQHAVARVRDLFARTLDYTVEPYTLDYGINPLQFGVKPEAKKQVVFFHGTTWTSKMWPVEYWQMLTRLAEADGYEVNLLWGNEEEEQRARKIASAGQKVNLLGKLGLTEIAQLLVNSTGVVAVDTGLAHLAAALGLPVVSLYGASDPHKTGTYGLHQLHLRPSLNCSPCMSKTCKNTRTIIVDQMNNKNFNVVPPCYSDNPPSLVWRNFNSLLVGAMGTLDNQFYPRT